MVRGENVGPGAHERRRIRAAEATTAAASASSGQSTIGGALGAVMSDDPRLVRINEILDEKVRPALMMDGGYLEVLGIKDNTLNIRYQGAAAIAPARSQAR